MVADVVEEDTEIVQDLEAAEADMEDQGQLTPRLLLSLEMNKPVRLRNFLHPYSHLFAISKLDFWGNLFRKCVSSKIHFFWFSSAKLFLQLLFSF